MRFDHNFLRDQVLENTEKALKKLGVSIYQFKPSFEIVKEMMIESFKEKRRFFAGTVMWEYQLFQLIQLLKKKSL